MRIIVLDKVAKILGKMLTIQIKKKVSGYRMIYVMSLLLKKLLHRKKANAKLKII
jgi:hypothetical protein